MPPVSKKEQEDLPESEFAFPRQRKEPLENASHVRVAVARFDQVEGVTNEERDEAWRRIQSAANKFSVELHEQDWREIFMRNNHPIPQE